MRIVRAATLTSLLCVSWFAGTPTAFATVPQTTGGGEEKSRTAKGHDRSQLYFALDGAEVHAFNFNFHDPVGAVYAGGYRHGVSPENRLLSVRALGAIRAVLAVLNIHSRRSTIFRDLGKAGLCTWRDSPDTRSQIGALLVPCECGGRFTFDAVPRCSRCRGVLSLDAVLSQLDPREWWKQGWRGTLGLVIEEGRVDAPIRRVPSNSKTRFW